MSNEKTFIPFNFLKRFADNDTKDFKETTPEGNDIEGKVLMSRDRYHGSLLIEKVNGEDCVQVVRGFPKIRYIDKDYDYFDDSSKRNRSPWIFTYVREKLDGTCVGFYNLFDHNGKFLEVVPKSRQRAVLDEHFRDMLKLCDTRLIYNLHRKYDVVYVEMYGMLNEHTLPHKQTYIDIRLIGATHRNSIKLMEPKLLMKLSQILSVKQPDRIAEINVYNDNELSLEFESSIFDDRIEDYCICESLQEIVEHIEATLDKRNKIYLEEKGYLKYEGVVIQRRVEHDSKYGIEYIKVKPETFREAFKGEGELTVPINEIRKEVYKIINENLTEYTEDYNEKETIQNIRNALLEEYSEIDVNHSKTRKVIVKELRKYIDSISDKGNNKLVDEILEKNPDESDPRKLMKYFASNYPMLKHKNQDIYNILEKRLRKLS